MKECLQNQAQHPITNDFVYPINQSTFKQDKPPWYENLFFCKSRMHRNIGFLSWQKFV